MTNELLLTGFTVKVKQVKSKKSEKRFDIAEFFVPELSGNIKIFQESSPIFSEVIEDKIKGLVIAYELHCRLYGRYDGSLSLEVVKITKKK